MLDDAGVPEGAPWWLLHKEALASWLTYLWLLEWSFVWKLGVPQLSVDDFFGVDIILIRYASHSLRYDITLTLFCFFFPAHPLKGILPKNPSVLGQKSTPKTVIQKMI